LSRLVLSRRPPATLFSFHLLLEFFFLLGPSSTLDLRVLSSFRDAFPPFPGILSSKNRFPKIIPRRAFDAHKWGLSFPDGRSTRVSFLFFLEMVDSPRGTQSPFLPLSEKFCSPDYEFPSLFSLSDLSPLPGSRRFRRFAFPWIFFCSSLFFFSLSLSSHASR